MERIALLFLMLIALLGCKQNEDLMKPVKVSAAYNESINPDNFNLKKDADFGWETNDVINRREINWLKVEFDTEKTAGKFLLTPSSRFVYRVIFNQKFYQSFSGDNKALHAKSYSSHPYVFEIKEDTNVIYIYFEKNSMHYGFMFDEMAIGTKDDIQDLALSMNKTRLINDQVDFYGAVNLMIIGILSILIYFLVNKKGFSILVFGITLLLAGIFHLRMSPFSAYLHDPTIGRRVSIFGFVLVFHLLYLIFANSFFKIKKKFINVILAVITLLLFSSALAFDHSFEWTRFFFIAFNLVLIYQILSSINANKDIDKVAKIILIIGFSFNTLIMISSSFLGHMRFKVFISPFSIGMNAIAMSMVFYMIKNYRNQIMELEHSKVKLIALQKENLTAELVSLKQQIDPHFLFNSLNTLITLIEESKDAAQNFVQELSKVYRYILQIKDKDLIEVRKELAFVKSYNFLLAQRFRENLKIKIDINEQYRHRLIIPAALQMLVENCVKHNVISSDKPLEIKISCDGKYLKIVNTLQPKLDSVDSEKIGLENLKRRFSYFTDTELQVIKTEDEFIVKLPIIEEID